jgi:hypothetical protein
MPTIFRQLVTAGDFRFNDAADKPEGAQYWNLDVFEGWLDTPELTVYSNALGGMRDGESMAAFTPLRARHMILEGYVLAETPLRAEQLWETIVRDVFPRNKLLEISRYTPAGGRKVFARREGPLVPDWSAVENGFRFQASLVASDPFKYSLEAIEVSGGVSGGFLWGRTYPRTYPLTYSVLSGDSTAIAIAYNEGTARSRNFTVSITGPLSQGAWRIVNETNGGSLMVYRSLGATDVITLDMKNELMTFNGSPFTATIRGDFWALEPGENRIRMYSSFNETATFTVSYYSAWE